MIQMENAESLLAEDWDVSTFTDLRESTIPFDRDPVARVESIRERVDRGPGFVVVKDVPLDGVSPEQAQEHAPELLRGLGRPLLQGQANRTYGWLVRSEGLSRFQDPEQSEYRAGVYTSQTSDHLDIHNDAAMQAYGNDPDYFALLTVRRAKTGGGSILISSRRVYNVLAAEYPRQLERLRRPFAFERQHVVLPGQETVSWGPVFEVKGGNLRVRCNRQRIEMGPALTGTPLTDEDAAALDAMDEVMNRPQLQFHVTLEQGDLLVVDDHKVLHARTSFEDYADPNERPGCGALRSERATATR